MKYVLVVLLSIISYSYVAHTAFKLGHRHGMKASESLLTKCADSITKEEVPPEEIAYEIGLKRDRLTANMAFGYYAGRVLGCYITELEK